jgi:ABC-2 type transport system ATP-binding protein
VTEAVIIVRGLRKRYGQHDAVKGIDLDVQQGEIFGLLGTNGAGKTTTLEILEGYRPRTSGDVSVLDVDPGNPTRAWRERIGLVLQESELDPVFTVRETVRMFARYFAHPRDVDETIALVGMRDSSTKRVGTLSGGQKRRVDVALGLIGDPDLLFLDEPTTGFDPQARRDAWNMIRGLRDLGTTVVLTTHYMEEAQHLADRLAILRDGVVVGSGTPDELVGNAARGRTVVRFRATDGVTPEQVQAVVGTPPERTGDELVLQCDSAQHTLYLLTSWAEREHLTLDGLEVTRPTLDDVFLELTGSEQASREQASREQATP